MYSNLGGTGPDVDAPARSIRYVNVGTIYNSNGDPFNIDLEVTNRSAYTPYDSSLNTKIGKFAQVNLMCNNEVELRVTIKLSCSSGTGCATCLELSGTARDACFAAGCSCFSTPVTSEAECTGSNRTAAKADYSCPLMDQNLILPGSNLVTMTVYGEAPRVIPNAACAHTTALVSCSPTPHTPPVTNHPHASPRLCSRAASCQISTLGSPMDTPSDSQSRATSITRRLSALLRAIPSTPQSQ